VIAASEPAATPLVVKPAALIRPAEIALTATGTDAPTRLYKSTMIYRKELLKNVLSFDL
jgi:hypothetical protein